MRAYIAQTIANDQQLQSMGLDPSAVFSAENVDTPGTRPFIVIRWTNRPPGIRTAPSQANMFDVRCYDTRGDFSRIDAMLERIKAILTSIKSQRTSTGWITQIDWEGDGGDGYDDVWEAIVRPASFKAIASYTVGVP